MHRLDLAEADLRAAEQRVLVDERTRRRIALLSADIAVQRGTYDAALATYERYLDGTDEVNVRMRMALAHQAAGNLQQADALLAQVLTRMDQEPDRETSHMVVWVHVQRGVLAIEAGDDASAHRHFDLAARTCSGCALLEHLHDHWHHAH